MRLYDIEAAALREIAVQHPEVEVQLTGLFASCIATKRENTGLGFFTTLSPDAEKYLPINMRSPIGDAWVSIEGINYGMCCIVFLSDGYPSLLEGFTLAGEDTSQIDFGDVQFTVGSFPEMILSGKADFP
jgi:hypothetical protein